MVYVWREKKLLFLAASATGSTAFIQHLIRLGVGEYLPKEDIHDGKKILIPRKHSTLDQLRSGGLWEAEFSTYTKSVGIRNPFSFHVAIYNRNRTRRMATANRKDSWIDKMPLVDKERYIRNLRKNASQSFEEFLKDQLESKTPTELQAPFHREIDVFLHQENLNTDARLLFDRIGADFSGEIARFNVTNKKSGSADYRSYYTPEMVDLVYEKHRPFFQRFPEYSFDGLAV
ncbi:MAG TPA: hypothetical protein VGG10_03320 [Rhizomicrobium sp.]|jgi:hypothetical protein